MTSNEKTPARTDEIRNRDEARDDECLQHTPKLGNLLDAVHSYRELGWCVFPLRGKKPLRRWAKLPSDRIVDDWFADPCATGIGVALGKRSGGLIARDFDSHDAYLAWCDQESELACDVPTSLTPGRGFHVFAKCDGPCKTMSFSPDGELRGDGAYVVLAPSTHPNGLRYQWLRHPFREIPTIDPMLFIMSEVRKRISKNEWDRTQLHLGVGSGVPPSEFRSLRNCSDQSLFIEQAIRLTLPLGYGERNNRLFELAYQLRWWFPAETPVDEFHPVIRDWHSRALPRIRTKDFSESWSDFQRAWSYGFTTSKFLSSVTAAYRAETLALGFNENQDRVARVFHAADAVTGGTAFWLGSRNIAEITGVCRSSANDWTRSLIDRGLLQVLEPGKFSRKQRSKATVWRWRGPE